MNPEMERVLRPRRQARESYNLLSRWYDRIASSEKPCLDMGIQLLDVQSGESVLEIGCGTGRILDRLLENTENGRLIALDLAEKMLQVAKKRMEGSIHLSFCQADGLLLPFPEGFFDAIFMGFTLELFDTTDIPEVLGECHRVLKAKGRIGIVALEKRDLVSVRIYEWFHRRLPEFIDCRPIHLRSLLEAARFKVPRSLTKSMWGLPICIALAGK